MDIHLQQCGTVDWASSFIDRDLTLRPDVVLVHLGTNDLKSMSPSRFSGILLELVQKIEQKYGCPVLISEVLPRRDRHKSKVDTANRLLRSNGLRTIEHRQITESHLFDEVHLGRFTTSGNDSGVELFAKDLYWGMYGMEPPPGKVSQATSRSRSPQRSNYGNGKGY